MSGNTVKRVRIRRLQWASRPYKVKAPKKPRPPPKPKIPLPDRFKKKQCHRKAYQAWIATFYNPQTGWYEWKAGVHDDWPHWWARWLANHPECRA